MSIHSAKASFHEINCLNASEKNYFARKFLPQKSIIVRQNEIKISET